MNLPEVKYVSKKTLKAIAVLNVTLAVLYEEFKSETGINISKSVFYKLKPPHIKCQNKSRWSQCLCEVCEKIELKCEAIKKIAKSSLLKNRFEISDHSLCAKSGKYNNKACIWRKCDDCDIDKFDEVLEVLGNSEVEWEEWAITKETHGDKVMSKNVKLSRRATVERFKEDLEERGKKPAKTFICGIVATESIQHCKKATTI